MAIDLNDYNGVALGVGNFGWVFGSVTDNGDGTVSLPGDYSGYQSLVPSARADSEPYQLFVTDNGNGTYSVGIGSNFFDGSPRPSTNWALEPDAGTPWSVVGTNGDTILIKDPWGDYLVITKEDMFSNYHDATGATDDGMQLNNALLDNAGAPTFPMAPCFAAGTRIATASGYVAVESLREGDLVITASGARRAVRWIGHSRVHGASHPRPWEVMPVRIQADAFGQGLPLRDLRVSPGHAVFVDGVLIPAGCLLNGATIVQEQVTAVQYFHIELDSHDVLLAEGLPCESYLDDGNRHGFSNAAEHVALHGRLDPQSWENACAPCVMAGPQLTEVRQRLLDRALALGHLRVEEADMHLVVDGARIDATHSHGQRRWFMVPAGAAEVGLVSRSGVLAHLYADQQDGRTLGVCVSDIRVDGQPVALDGDALAGGFYPLETQGAAPWRWTNGQATLRIGAGAAPVMVEVSTVMQMVSWQAPALRMDLAA
ncbi:Hint domain-containing protein [Cupriavidus sp. WS]|uniref:Hint domain-containing protein n=1 Tax=Cupriavidus sp. WS TaxID=1312922 RepID=UPI0012DEF920|nr:Hint domain-containing protein [Cupriavidus sp. WS]